MDGMDDQDKQRTYHIYDVLRRVEIHGCATLAKTQWQISDTYAPKIAISAESLRYPYVTGNLIRLGFERPDTNTGEIGTGYSRWEFVADDASDDTIIKTGYLLAKLIAEHEVAEAFLVDGVRIFDTHQSVEQLKVGKVAI